MSNSINKNLDLNSDNKPEIKANTEQRYPVEQSTELGSM